MRCPHSHWIEFRSNAICEEFIAQLTFFSLTANLGEVEDVEEVHRSNHHQHHADFKADEFDRFDGVLRFLCHAQEQADEADVDQIETNHEQMIHTVGHFFFAEGLNEKNPPIAA